jgi:hypothetical protein
VNKINKIKRGTAKKSKAEDEKQPPQQQYGEQLTTESMAHHVQMQKNPRYKP